MPARLSRVEVQDYGRAISGRRLSVTYLGHATVVLDVPGAEGRLITDPVLGRRVGHLRRLGPHVPDEALAGVAAVLVSHVHHDHLDAASLRRLGAAIPVVAPAGAGRLLRRMGLRQVVEVLPGQCTTVAGIRVEATPATHRASRIPGAGAVPALGYVVGEDPRTYFAGDTDLFAGMEAIGAPGLDVALLPVTGWGRRTPSGHLDPERAAAALRLLRPRVAVPIHWGTLAPSWWRQRDAATLRAPARSFSELARSAAPDVAVRILEPGQSLVVPPVARARTS